MNYQTLEKFQIGSTKIPLIYLVTMGKIEGQAIINENDL